MGCRLSDFVIGEWETITSVKGQKVELAPAAYRSAPSVIEGYVWKVDGKFKGLTGSKEAVIYHTLNPVKT